MFEAKSPVGVGWQCFPWLSEHSSDDWRCFRSLADWTCWESELMAWGDGGMVLIVVQNAYIRLAVTESSFDDKVVWVLFAWWKDQCTLHVQNKECPVGWQSLPRQSSAEHSNEDEERTENLRTIERDFVAGEISVFQLFTEIMESVTALKPSRPGKPHDIFYSPVAWNHWYHEIAGTFVAKIAKAPGQIDTGTKRNNLLGSFCGHLVHVVRVW